MLITPIRPNTMARPSAIRSRIEPSERPWKADLDGRGQERPALHPLHRVRRRLAQRRRRLRRPRRPRAAGRGRRRWPSVPSVAAAAARSASVPALSRISAMACSSSYRTQRSVSFASGLAERRQRAGIARVSHLGRGALAHRPVRVRELRAAGERVDERADGEPEATAGGHLFQRRRDRRAAACRRAPRIGVPPVGGEQRARGSCRPRSPCRRR